MAMLLLAQSVFVNCKYVAKCVFQRSNELNMFINTYLSWSFSNLSRQNAIFDTSDRVCEPSQRARRVHVFLHVISSACTLSRSQTRRKIGPLLLETEAPISRTRNGSALERDLDKKAPFSQSLQLLRSLQTETASGQSIDYVQDVFGTERWFFLGWGGLTFKKKTVS